MGVVTATIQQIQCEVPPLDALFERHFFDGFNIGQIAKWFVVFFDDTRTEKI
jgi:hypothetical protein